VTVALIGNPTRTNLQIVHAWRRLGVEASVLWPRETFEALEAGDTAITRLDVLPTLDGVEPGLDLVRELEYLDIRLLNRPDALLATHDKLATARLLSDAGIPHPWTTHVEPGRPCPAVPFPCVLKPRFGSWGQDVLLCHTVEDLARMLTLIGERPWWRQHGALLQELVGPVRRDVRVVVADGKAIAGAQRVAAEGEWRTNVTLGGTLTKSELPPGTEELAVRAAEAIGIDFAGVDLLPVGSGWTVLELNGAVDFDSRYSLPGVDPYLSILQALDIATPALREAERRQTVEYEAKEVEMVKTVQGKPARAGDEIVITGHSVGVAPRTAVILEVLGDPGHERFRVRWEDGHESIFFPGEDAVVRRPARRRAKSTA
jgi:RimK family alpha-L-glutamate ligase